MNSGKGKVGKTMTKLLKSGRSSSINGSPKVELAEDFTWGTRDYIQSPLAFIIGSLHALPDESNGPYCSGNATALRSNIIEGFEIGDQQQPLEAALAYYTAGGYLDEVGVLCQQSITSTLGVSHFTDEIFGNPLAVPTNLAYNAGFMWVDAINYVYFTPATVPQNDWAFFVSYLLGDFIIRIFYHDPTPQQVTQ